MDLGLVAGDVELDARLAHSKDGAVLQVDLAHAQAAHEGAVFGAGVAQQVAALVDLDGGVEAADRRVVEHDVVVRRAADLDLALLEGAGGALIYPLDDGEPVFL